MTNRPKKRAPTTPREVTDAEIDAAINDAFASMQAAVQSNTLHDLFNRQVSAVMDDAGLTEDEKQAVLVAMACPCCGSGTASFTYKLKPKA